MKILHRLFFSQIILLCYAQNANKTQKEITIEFPKHSEPELPRKRKKDSFPTSTTKPEKKQSKNKNHEKTKTKIKKKTKFEEFIEKDKIKTGSFDQFDLEMEKKLAKKLKIKNGKLGGFDDGLDMLLDGIPSTLDDEGDSRENVCEEILKTPSAKKRMKVKKEKKFPDTELGTAKYVAPHLRSCSNSESEEISQMRRRVRGKLYKFNFILFRTSIFGIIYLLTRAPQPAFGIKHREHHP